MPQITLPNNENATRTVDIEPSSSRSLWENAIIKKDTAINAINIHTASGVEFIVEYVKVSATAKIVHLFENI
jgi:hypothetical protein